MTGAGPQVDSFVLRDHKITRFLLAPEHPDNKGRAKFLSEFGFRADRPDILARALLLHPRAGHTFRDQTGRISERRLVYDGMLRTPDGRSLHVRTVWNYDTPPAALFITAFPLEKRDR